VLVKSQSLCIECKWHKKLSHSHFCKHPQIMGIDPVDGEAIWGDCREERDVGGKCIGGRLFEPKETT
jgi:hypothetical protein